MNLDDFNPDAPMNEEQMINLLTGAIVTARLEALETELPMLVNQRFSGALNGADWDTVDRLACNAYRLMISAPKMIVQVMGGPVELGGMMTIHGNADPDPVGKLADKLSEGFSRNSPTMGKLINADIVRKVVRLTLHDWLANPEASIEEMEMDTHFYLQSVLITDTDLAQIRNSVKHEALSNMSPEDYAKAPPEVKAEIDKFRRENGLE